MSHCPARGYGETDQLLAAALAEARGTEEADAIAREHGFGDAADAVEWLEERAAP